MHSLCTGAGSSGSADFVARTYDPSEHAADKLIELQTTMSAADTPERPETPERARMEDGQPDGPDGAARTRIEDCQLPETPETWKNGQPDGPDHVPDTVPDNNSDVPSDDSDDKSDFHVLVLHCNLFHMQHSQRKLTLGRGRGVLAVVYPSVSDHIRYLKYVRYLEYKKVSAHQSQLAT